MAVLNVPLACSVGGLGTDVVIEEESQDDDVEEEDEDEELEDQDDFKV